MPGESLTGLIKNLDNFSFDNRPSSYNLVFKECNYFEGNLLLIESTIIFLITCLPFTFLENLY